MPTAERDNLVNAYYQLLTSPDELARMSAAKAWASWEFHCSKLRPSDVTSMITKQHNALALARIESHFFMHDGFIKENQILNNISKIADIPAKLVHGRYDMVCPLDNAVTLHENWPGSELYIVRDAGHSASEPGIVDALIRATKELSELLLGESR